MSGDDESDEDEEGERETKGYCTRQTGNITSLGRFRKDEKNLAFGRRGSYKAKLRPVEGSGEGKPPGGRAMPSSTVRPVGTTSGRVPAGTQRTPVRRAPSRPS